MGHRAWIIAFSEFVSHPVHLEGVYATALRESSTRARARSLAESGAEPVEHQRRAADCPAREPPDRAPEADRRCLGVNVDDRGVKTLEVARSRVVVDAHVIADDKLGEGVDRLHGVQQVQACVDRSGDRGQVHVELARGDRLKQQALRGDRRSLEGFASVGRRKRRSPRRWAAACRSAHERRIAGGPDGRWAPHAVPPVCAQQRRGRRITFADEIADPLVRPPNRATAAAAFSACSARRERPKNAGRDRPFQAVRRPTLYGRSASKPARHSAMNSCALSAGKVLRTSWLALTNIVPVVTSSVTSGKFIVEKTSTRTGSSPPFAI
jgi:hypothetical protein